MVQVAIVGAGIGGISTANDLAQEGFDLQLFEQEDTIGGLCRSETLDGYTVDTGVHFPFRSQLVGELETRYSTSIPVAQADCQMVIRSRYRGYRIPYNFLDKRNANTYFSSEEIATLKSIFSAIFQCSMDPQEYATKSVLDVIGDIEMSRKVFQFMDYLTGVCYGTTIDYTPVMEFLRRFSEPNKAAVIPTGGFGALAAALAQRVRSSITANTTVETVLIEDGAVTGIVVDGESVEADIVVLNVPPQKVLSMVEEAVLAPAIVERIRQCVPWYGFTAWYGLNQRVFAGPHPVVLTDGDIPIAILPVSEFDPDRAPAGKQLIGVIHSVASKPDLSKQEERVQVENILEAQMYNLFDFMDGFVHTQLLPVMHDRQLIGKSGEDRVPIETNIEGLYFVGSGTKGHEVGLFHADETGQQCAARIIERYRS